MIFLSFSIFNRILCTTKNIDIIEIIGSINNFATKQYIIGDKKRLKENFYKFKSGHVKPYKYTQKANYFAINNYELILKREEGIRYNTEDKVIREKISHPNISDIMFYFSQDYGDKFIEWVIFEKPEKFDKEIINFLSEHQKQKILDDTCRGLNYIFKTDMIHNAAKLLSCEFYGKRRNRKNKSYINRSIFKHIKQCLVDYNLQSKSNMFTNIIDFCSSEILLRKRNFTRSQRISIISDYRNSLDVRELKNISHYVDNSAKSADIDNETNQDGQIDNSSKLCSDVDFIDLHISIVKSEMNNNILIQLVITIEACNTGPYFFKTYKEDLKHELLLSVLKYEGKIRELINDLNEEIAKINDSKLKFTKLPGDSVLIYQVCPKLLSTVEIFKQTIHIGFLSNALADSELDFIILGYSEYSVLRA
ncbi:hypothetical protein COBT_001150 [Conglomerata obtusa]